MGKGPSRIGPVNWKKVVFSDEKKFILDGPDGLAYYWHEIRSEKQYFEKLQQKSERVMVWAAILYYCVNRLAIVEANRTRPHIAEH